MESTFERGYKQNRVSVQRFFTKKLFQRCGISSSGYHDRLSKLNLKTLEHRRLVADLVMVFKMLNNYIDVDPNVLFNLKPNNYNLRGHSQTLIRTRATSNTLLNSFPSRIVRIWNNLPEYVVCSSSIGFFKHHVNQGPQTRGGPGVRTPLKKMRGGPNTFGPPLNLTLKKML